MKIQEFEDHLPDQVIIKLIRLYHNQIKSVEAVHVNTAIKYDAAGLCRDTKGNRLPELDIKL